MFSKLKYWFKRLTAIKVYNEDQLRIAIGRVRGEKQAIAVLDNIAITQNLLVPPNIIFIFRAADIRVGSSLYLEE